MTPTIGITLAILAFLIVMLFTHKIPYGMAAMICCIAFVVTGIADIPTAFSGFSSSTTILVATMMVIGIALGKTSIIHKLKGILNNMQGKKGIALVATICVITFALSQMMGQTEVMTLMVIFLTNLSDESEVSPARMLFTAAVINTVATAKLPIGIGLSSTGTINGLYSGFVADESQLLGLMDYFKAGIVPCIICFVYCLLFYKLLPSQKMNTEAASIGDIKADESISKKDEMIIFACFFAVLAGYALTNVIGFTISNIIPAICVVVLLLTKVLTMKEAVSTMTSDIVFMIAGMQAVSTVLSSTGVGNLIGEMVLSILGGNPSAIMVISVFCIVTTIMTNFISNMGTMALMIPIAAATALAGGFNVKTIVLVTAVSSWFSIAFPTGSGATLIAFGVGNFKFGETLKFTLPLILLLMISLIISINAFFPVFA